MHAILRAPVYSVEIVPGARHLEGTLVLALCCVKHLNFSMQQSGSPTNLGVILMKLPCATFGIKKKKTFYCTFGKKIDRVSRSFFCFCFFNGAYVRGEKRIRYFYKNIVLLSNSG